MWTASKTVILSHVMNDHFDCFWERSAHRASHFSQKIAMMRRARREKRSAKSEFANRMMPSKFKVATHLHHCEHHLLSNRKSEEKRKQNHSSCRRFSSFHRKIVLILLKTHNQYSIKNSTRINNNVLERQCNPSSSPATQDHDGLHCPQRPTEPQRNLLFYWHIESRRLCTSPPATIRVLKLKLKLNHPPRLFRICDRRRQRLAVSSQHDQTQVSRTAKCRPRKVTLGWRL
jgi:hypothetical protein